MLVLSRRLSQNVIIGNDITVRVLDIKGGQVRFGIDAPRNVVVDREEVHLKKEREAAVILQR